MSGRRLPWRHASHSPNVRAFVPLRDRSMYKEAFLIFAFVVAELGMGAAIWLIRRDLRGKLAGTPAVDKPFNVLWATPIVLIAGVVGFYFARQGDWLSMGMQLLLAATTILSMWQQARRCVVKCVPVEQVSAWMEEVAPKLGSSAEGWRLTDHWMEHRSVSIELPAAWRAELLALVAALRPMVEQFPSPGRWEQPGLAARIAPPVLLGCMLLLPVAFWLR